MKAYRKDPGSDLLQFVIGIVMLTAGLFIFSQKVHISSFGMGFGFGSFHVSSGLIIVPLIAGIVWMFIKNGLLAKIWTALSVLLIVVAIIMSTSMYLSYMTLFDWVVILVLIFGGAAFIAKQLFFGGGDSKYDEK